MERYMKLMLYDPSNWLDLVSMLVKGVVSSWVNTIWQEVSTGHKLVFRTCGQSRDAMAHWFDPIIEVKEACKQLCNLWQSGWIGVYIQCF